MNQALPSLSFTAAPIPEPALFLCRSPFQAVLIERIIEQEKIEDFDLVYYNPAVSSKDRYYFQRISRGARRSLLFSRSSPRGWLEFLLIIARLHGSIFVGNHTFSVYRLAVSRKKRAAVYSFDEGDGNFNPKGALQVDRRNRLERLRDWLMRAPPALAIFEKSVAHYTIDAAQSNVVAACRLREVEFGSVAHADQTAGNANLLIGQPFAEYLNPDEISTLHDAFRRVPNALYIPHPREDIATIPEDFQVFHDERIFEEVVFSLRSAGKKVRLIGCSSTVLASLRGSGIEKYSLEVGGNQERIQLMQDRGCETFDLGTAGGAIGWQQLTAEWSAC